MAKSLPEPCIICTIRTFSDGFRSKRAGFVCYRCAVNLGWAKSDVMQCGQSCPGGPRDFPKKPMSQLAKGDILPRCPHRVRCRVVRVLRQGPYDTLIEVRTKQRVKEGSRPFSKEPWAAHLYGPPETLVDIEPPKTQENERGKKKRKRV